MKPPSPRRIEAAMSAAMQLREELRTSDDSKLLQDSLEGCTDVFEVLDRFAELAIADSALVTLGSARLKRIEARSDRWRSIIMRMLEALDLKGLDRPFYTASIANGAGSVDVFDATQIPPAFLRTAPDKQKIAHALRDGERVPGARMSNGPPALRILTR